MSEGDVVLNAHTRDDKAEGGGFHDVDDESAGQESDLDPVGASEGRVFGRGDFIPGAGGRGVAGHQTPGGGKKAGDDEEHAKQHAVAHGHAGQMEVVVAAHPEHGNVQEHADGDGDTTRPEAEGVGGAGKERRFTPHAAFLSSIRGPMRTVRDGGRAVGEPWPIAKCDGRASASPYSCTLRNPRAFEEFLHLWMEPCRPRALLDSAVTTSARTPRRTGTGGCGPS